MATGRRIRPLALSDRFVLIDTDVVSFILKKDSRAELYLERIGDRSPVLSFQTTGELLRWAVYKKWGADRRKRLDEFIRNCRVIPWSGELSQKWAALTSEGLRRGTPCEAGDGWIAATALLYSIPLVTNNRKDFEWMKALGLELICGAPPL
jgi:tRNA(fMet)-specific endonuclease VapC